MSLKRKQAVVKMAFNVASNGCVIGASRKQSYDRNMDEQFENEWRVF
jgi:hypothetical protein